ncbi:LacI family transcriptional regulator [Psychroflexus gondwanensis]|jgi:LacI family transcriptional regulator|uniref:LacI family transcriptional regulator n=1 Tax=Psychroflexus gondwanensis ACAM 44 TaxID=1189619 RepID=N1WZ42_9FLAO|nr:LacI family DNA-binding transcriptional regulator [Psychroflexus gondwanensis]EMY82442.1 LacI family transcriptional regulator [Psychroflexus gondwanensis ACAM 44]TXE18936.1 LacI family transcriptional regulator [Psychroflexus gondwanensis]
MKQKPTLKVIAKELDVSVSTVSKALRDSKEIGEETKRKVKAFAKLYNYRPNNIALSLKNKKTKTLGVIIPEIVHHFFTTVISGIEHYANDKGYNVIVGLSNESFKKEVINLEMLANGSIDGFIISVAKETLSFKDFHHLSETIDQGIPIVMFDRVIDDIECDKVIVDDVKTSAKAVQKLIDGGCKNIGIISTKDYVSVGRLRTEGYKNALNANHIEIQKSRILKIDDKFNSDDNIEFLEEQIYTYFEENEVDGLFAVNELYAITAMKVARQKGLTIPDDLQVIGFTDGVLSKHAFPPLTTISQHGFEMGEESAKLLIDRLENPNEDEEPFKTIVVKTDIIDRETTKLHNPKK